MGGPATSATVGRTIRASRERAQLPLASVARKCNLSEAQLEGIECGRARPTLAVLDRIARALGLSLVELVLAPAAPAEPAEHVDPRPGLTAIAQAILALPEAVGSKIDVVEAATVLVALTACQENQSAAARLLGMDRKAFVRRLSRARRSKLGPGASAQQEE
jgi:transcriptional regulator with XRE-family HTH domain